VVELLAHLLHIWEITSSILGQETS